MKIFTSGCDGVMFRPERATQVECLLMVCEKKCKLGKTTNDTGIMFVKRTLLKSTTESTQSPTTRSETTSLETSPTTQSETTSLGTSPTTQSETTRLETSPTTQKPKTQSKATKPKFISTTAAADEEKTSETETEIKAPKDEETPIVVKSAPARIMISGSKSDLVKISADFRLNSGIPKIPKIRTSENFFLIFLFSIFFLIF